MIFTFAIPFLLLTATANGAVLPDRGPTEVENRDCMYQYHICTYGSDLLLFLVLDDLGEIRKHFYLHY